MKADGKAVDLPPEEGGGRARHDRLCRLRHQALLR
jgi:hypothetical protein